MEIKKNTNQHNNGFALLVTLIVVGVVLSVGLTILDLSIKQVRLSTNARDSEVAFHAANAGAECARFWRREESDAMLTGQQIDFSCFGENDDDIDPFDIPVGLLTEPTPAIVGDGEAYQYEYQFEWGTKPRCTQINTVVASSTVDGSGLTIVQMETLVPGYSGGNSYFCDTGSQCTVLSVRGYNRPCATVNGYGTVQREVLLQF